MDAIDLDAQFLKAPDHYQVFGNLSEKGCFKTAGASNSGVSLRLRRFKLSYSFKNIQLTKVKV